MSRIDLNLEASRYHAMPEISKHKLDTLAKAPALLKWEQENPREQTDTMWWGSVVHTAILEPLEFAKKFACANPELKRSAKKAWAEFEEQTGKEALTFEEVETLLNMAKAMNAHKAACKIMTGQIEASLFWTDEDTGVACRCRPDVINKNLGMVIDLKTCASASAASFAKDAYNFRYHVQAAFYLDACKAVGIEVDSFVFVCVEKTAPYLVAVYACDQAMIELGRATYKANLETYKRCAAEDSWPGYSQDIEILSLPSYAK